MTLAFDEPNDVDDDQDVDRNGQDDRDGQKPNAITCIHPAIVVFYIRCGSKEGVGRDNKGWHAPATAYQSPQLPAFDAPSVHQ